MIELHNADCLAHMRTMPDNSVDAIVTDPPYGLSFMGKKWDYDVPSEEVWAECLRVLKPGGHLLAFAGTRTQHRMAVRIEDAGFEIRDMIAWVYGSGFPKSLDVSKAIDKKGGDGLARAALAKRMRELLDASGKDRSEIDKHFGTANVSQYWFSPHRNAQVVPADKWPWVREWLGAGDEMDAEVWFLNGRKGQPGPNWAKREVVGATRKGAQQQSTGRYGAWGDGITPTAPATAAAQQWQGWGTALKPALEPITVARKPLEGTVAANVLEHGTGALNIDGCRVEADWANDPSMRGVGYGSTNDGFPGDGGAVKFHEQSREWRPTQGRWPANLIHDGSEDVVGIFPDRKVAPHGPGVTAGDSVFGIGDGGARCYSDTGSAARFFYCAKASKADRDEGCEGMEERVAGVGDVDESSGRDSTKPGNQYGDGSRRRVEAGLSPTIPRRNHHPTVKPTALMRYLCRLVTPPGGTVLDPFMGSGSTGKAAKLEGFSFIGIEREAEYIAIAQARIDGAKMDPPKQPDLFA